MIRIVTDSTASIPHAMACENDIEVVSLFLNYNGVEYEDATMDVDAFYEDIQNMVTNIPTSSQPDFASFESVFERAAQAGDEVLGVFMSSRMSGTVEGALQAARSVAARFADLSYRIIDSTSNSFDEAWAVLAAAKGRDEGRTLDECVEIAQNSIRSARYLFTPESLRFLKAGGRIGNAAALLGAILKLCPIFTVFDGETTTFAKVRTQKKALAAIAGKLQEDVAEYGLKNAVVHYIGSKDAARRWAQETIEPICGRSVDVVPVSPVIGLHVGPAIGISYECERCIPGKVSESYPSLVYAS